MCIPCGKEDDSLLGFALDGWFWVDPSMLGSTASGVSTSSRLSNTSDSSSSLNASFDVMESTINVYIDNL